MPVIEILSGGSAVTAREPTQQLAAGEKRD